MDVRLQDFEQQVIARSRDVPVVVDFWAAWCGPCRTLGPVLERLEAEAAGAWVLAKVDVDAAPELAQRFGVQGIPAVKAFVDGRVVAEFVGAQPRAQVERWLRGVVPSEVDRLVAEGSEASLRDALTRDPAHTLARAKLAFILVQADPEAARALLPEGAEREAGRLAAQVRLRLEAGDEDPDALRARLEAEPGDHEARWRLAMTLAARDDLDAALGHLLDIVRANRKFRDDGARREMLRLFDVAGSRSPVSDRWRDRLAKVLY